jgi:hypothetical protein
MAIPITLILLVITAMFVVSGNAFGGLFHAACVIGLIINLAVVLSSGPANVRYDAP